MTDRPQDDELEQSVSEDITEEGTRTESWQDDLPPEDDFHDMDEPLGEEIEGEPAPEEAEEQTAVDKSRGKKVLFAVLAVAAALVGGMVYLQIGSLSPETSERPMSAMLDVKDAQEAKPAATQETLPAPVTPKTGEADISSLYKAAQIQSQGNIATALPNENAGEKEGDKAALGTSTNIMGLSDAQEPAPAPAPLMAPPPAPAAPEVAKVENIPMPELQPQPEEKAKTLPLPVAPPPPAVTPVVSADVDAKLKEMNAQIEALKAALDTAVQKLEAVQKNGGSVLEERIDSLEKKVENQKAERTSSIALQETQGMKEEAVSAEPSKEIKAPVKKASKAKKPVKKTTPAKKTTKLSKKTESWVLRAATPDAAWVSKGDYAAELRRVAVGETLPGIGKVEEIRQKGDVWEVVGSKGVLK